MFCFEIILLLRVASIGRVVYEFSQSLGNVDILNESNSGSEKLIV